MMTTIISVIDKASLSSQRKSNNSYSHNRLDGRRYHAAKADNYTTTKAFYLTIVCIDVQGYYKTKQTFSIGTSFTIIIHTID